MRLQNQCMSLIVADMDSKINRSHFFSDFRQIELVMVFVLLTNARYFGEESSFKVANLKKLISSSKSEAFRF